MILSVPCRRSLGSAGFNSLLSSNNSPKCCKIVENCLIHHQVVKACGIVELWFCVCVHVWKRKAIDYPLMETLILLGRFLSAKCCLSSSGKTNHTVLRSCKSICIKPMVSWKLQKINPMGNAAKPPLHSYWITLYASVSPHELNMHSEKNLASKGIKKEV